MDKEAKVEGACDMRKVAEVVIVVVGAKIARREATW